VTYPSTEADAAAAAEIELNEPLLTRSVEGESVTLIRTSWYWRAIKGSAKTWIAAEPELERDV
jgi:hypothetical protein